MQASDSRQPQCQRPRTDTWPDGNTLAQDIAPADRAGLVDASFIAAYLALSLPTVIAGLASQHYGLRHTALVYIAVIAALVAAAAATTSLRRPPPRSGQAVSQPPGRDLGREEPERMGRS